MRRDPAARLGRALRAAGCTVAVAESCTGGALCAAITDVPGSSAYFLGGVVAYANESKIRDLGVRADLLASRGAVSAETAAAMARGARKRFDADIGVGITGIAGPGGGAPGKPVGTVYIAIAFGARPRVRRYRFPGDREAVRRATVIRALADLFAATGGVGGPR